LTDNEKREGAIAGATASMIDISVNAMPFIVPRDLLLGAAAMM
jgi:hypothetical protein